MQRPVHRLRPALGVAVLAACLSACGTSATRTRSTARGQATATAARFVKPPAGIGAVQLFHPIALYTEYADAKLEALHPQLSALNRAISVGDISAARAAWLTAHLTWLQIGQDDGQYGAFGTLGGRIDATAEGDVGGTASRQFTGFHRVELDLFARSDLTAARTDAARLTALVNAITPSAVNADLPLDFLGLDNWVLRTHEILEDALRDSLSENDNYGSDSDLASVGADVSATREMLALLSRLIEPRSPGLVSTATRQLDAIDAAITAVPAHTEPADLPLRARQRLNGAVSAALETLAPVSELMQISNANS